METKKKCFSWSKFSKIFLLYHFSYRFGQHVDSRRVCPTYRGKAPGVCQELSSPFYDQPRHISIQIILLLYSLAFML